MITVRRSNERGTTKLHWLDSKHTFSFGDYYDPAHMDFRSLRVINDDRIAPGGGFGMHGHRDMEIITYVIEGELEHRDSLGTGSVIRRGDVQRMSAGTGIRHSEFNPSSTAPVHLLQIWLTPERAGLKPEYEQRHFADAEKQGKLRLVAARDGRDGAIRIHQDAELHAAVLQAGERAIHQLDEGRAAWVQVARGSLALNGVNLDEGDGAAITEEGRLELTGRGHAEVLLFDLG